jgi:hypothetical protein
MARFECVACIRKPTTAAGGEGTIRRKPPPPPTPDQIDLKSLIFSLTHFTFSHNPQSEIRTPTTGPPP